MADRILLLSAGVFVSVVIGALGLYRVLGDSEARRLRRRLREITTQGGEGEAPPAVILRDLRHSGSPGIGALLRLPGVAYLDRLLIRADVNMQLGALLTLMAVFAFVPVAAAVIVLHTSPWVAIAGAGFGAIPVLWLQYQKGKRVRTFERQLPDALDILTSALRSGMAFSGAVQIVSEECAETVAKEFTILFEENRLGIDMRVALRNLAERVDSKELHLFVIAVILQRETGGNLVEILEGTSHVIRERLRILGDVRALTAQARLSAVILSVLPVVVGMFIVVTAPDYMRVLLREPSGRNLLLGAAVLQIIGFLIMRRIATIKV